MRIVAEFILVVVSAIAWLSVGQVVATETITPFFNNFIIPVMTLAAAFGGSWYAFKLQENKTKRDADARDVKAANSAIFELTRSYLAYPVDCQMDESKRVARSLNPLTRMPDPTKSIAAQVSAAISAVRNPWEAFLLEA